MREFDSAGGRPCLERLGGDAGFDVGLEQSMQGARGEEPAGAPLIVLKATFNALLNLPYCLARRKRVDSPDFKLPGA